MTIAIVGAASGWAAAVEQTAPVKMIAIRGAVLDALKRPIPGVSLELQSASGKTLRRVTSNARGEFTFRRVPAGIYAVVAHKRGFKLATIILEAGTAKPVELTLESEQPLSLPVIVAQLNQARNALSPETGSTVYRFTEKSINELPQGENTPLNEVVVQAPGWAQDSYGQGQDLTHVHGLNGGGIQYRLNGVFLPEAVSSFGMFFSPQFVQSIALVTNFMPAQFGYRNEGVIDIQTKDGCLDNGGQLQYFGGQRGTIQPSFQYGGCTGKLSYYISGFYLQDYLGVASPTPTPNPIHDRTYQGQGFSYLSYLFNPATQLSLITGTAENFFQIPGQPGLPVEFPLEGVSIPPDSDNLDETEFEQNYYGILALHSDPIPKLDYQIALFSRYYSLNYNPDPIGDLMYNGIADTVLHTGFINGIQEDTSYRLNDHHTLQAGFYMSGETLKEDNHALVFPLNPMTGIPETTPIRVVDNFNGRAILVGLYAQDQWKPTEKLELTLGVRWDLMDYQVNQHQFSPRAGVVYKLFPTTELNAGYARYFQVPPFESVLLETVSKFANTSAASSISSGNQDIKAEDDNFFDVGLNQVLPLGFHASVEGYFFLAVNKLDLAQFGNTYIFAPLQYANGRGWGSDFSLAKTSHNLSTYFNFSYEVAQAKDIVGGQFLADNPAELAYIANHYITLDDDQKFIASSGLSYHWLGFLLMVDGFWGSGYRQGFANLSTVNPYLQVNAAIARMVSMPHLGQVEGRLSVVNLFDHIYQIRSGSGVGVFAPSYGARRAVYFTVTLPLGAVHRAGQTP